jgi:hypothetical protein
VGGFRLVSLETLAADVDTIWETLDLKVVAEERHALVAADAKPARVRRALRRAKPVATQEVWSFLRRRGRKSLPGSPALDGKCPRCGLALADDARGPALRCGGCGAVANSGEHDWVVAEITPSEDWRVDRGDQETPGIAELRRRDPAASRQAIEDRGALLFWRWVAARATGDFARLSRLCVRPPESDPDRYALARAALRDVVLRGTELLGVEPAGGEFTDDRAAVEVRWSGAVDGQDPEGMVHLLLLARAPGAPGARAHDCPHCGASLAANKGSACPACGVRLQGAPLDWSLEAVESRGGLGAF